jgi:serine/threonine protein kinase
MCGTPQYVAPEVLIEDTYDGMKSDIYSLGVVLHGLVTGRLPFEDEDTLAYYAYVENYQKIVASKSKIPRPLPRITHNGELEEILQKMLSINPRKRSSLKSVACCRWFLKRTKSSFSQDSQALVISCHSSTKYRFSSLRKMFVR